MVATTPTWEIPYAEDTDPFCDGCTITQSMAERIDEILNEFDTSFADASVIPLARASRLTPQATPPSSVSGGIIYTSVDFDTTGIADLNQPTNPITVDDDHFWLIGGYMQWDSTATTGNEGISAGSAEGSSAMTYAYRQRVAPTTGDDQFGQFAGAAMIPFPTDRISVQHGVFSTVFRTYVWTWRIGEV